MARTPTASNLLTEAKIKSLKVREKDYTLRDGGGLFLTIRAIGTKLWVIRYTLNKKPKRTTIGNYPIVSLAQAREKNREYQSMAKQGICLTVQKNLLKQEQTLALYGQLHIVAKHFFEEVVRGSITEDTYSKKIRRFERDILPFFATFKEGSNGTIEDVESSRHISTIHHGELMEAISKIAQRGAIETAHRVLNDCNSLWLYAVGHGHASFNIVANIDKKHALPKAPVSHLPSTTDIGELKRYFSFANGFKSNIMTHYALLLLPYVFLRIDNLRALEWREVDFERKMIVFQKERMKTKHSDFALPLSDSALVILKEINHYTRHSPYVFPSPLNFSKAMSGNTIGKLMRENGFGGILTPHGFRSTFSSIAYSNMHEHLMSAQVIEACMHHAEKNKVAGAYNYQAKYTEQMKILVNWYGKWLDLLR